jgi:hypothetical protein
VEQVNRSQTEPTARQLERIRARLDTAVPLLSKKTATMLRFVSKPA